MTPARARILLVAAIVGLAAMIRLRFVGDIVAHGDEQFYLLVGDRILNHGAVPYLDIWDRKPVGLFLLYAGIRLFGGTGIAEYQLVGAGVAAVTAAILGLWVQRATRDADDDSAWFTSFIAGLGAAMLYLAILQSHLGFGGQAEVFLNLLVVSAGALVHRLLLGRGNLLAHGAAAMLVMGLALQLKPTAVFPGIWLGLTLVWLGWRAGWRLPRLGGAIVLWVGLALLPTLAAVGWYTAHGHFDAYVFANLLSITAKGSDGGDAVETLRAVKAVLRLGVPFGAAIALLALGWWLAPPPPERRRTLIFLLGWLLSGVAAFFAVRSAYPHYTLVAAPMGCLLVGYACGLRRPLGWAMVAVGLAMSLWLLQKDFARLRSNRIVAPRLASLAATIRPELRGGCLYVYHGPVVLYMLTDSCLPTRFAFPNHLSTIAEANGLGVDATAEVARILATRPPVVVDGQFNIHGENEATLALVHRVLARDYVRLGEVDNGLTEPLAVAYRLKRRGEGVAAK